MATATRTRKAAAEDPTRAFFEGVGEAGHQPLLQNVSGTLRFDLKHGGRIERWYVSIKKGDVAVSRKNAPADAVVTADKALFDDVASGRANTMAATLRGVLVPHGNIALMIAFQRLFPGPPAKAGPRTTRLPRRTR